MLCFNAIACFQAGPSQYSAQCPHCHRPAAQEHAPDALPRAVTYTRAK